MKDHVAHLWSVHPSKIRIEDGLARSVAAPLNVQALHVEEARGEVRVRSAGGEGRLDLSSLHDFWRARLGIGRWFGEDLFGALVERFVSLVRIEAPDALAAAGEHGCLFLGNHQVGIESVLFSIASPVLMERPTAVIAKAEHRESWIGRLIGLSFSHPGLKAPELLAFVDREDPKEVLEVIARHCARTGSGGQNLLIHAEGTRARGSREPVRTASTAVIDAGVEMSLPIVPVRFARGLPAQAREARFEFPVGYGRQEIWVGAPLGAGELAPLPSVERRTRVLEAINRLGDVLQNEEPCAPDTRFADRVRREREVRGADEAGAVLACVLSDLGEGCAQTRRLRAIVAGEISPDESDPIDAWLSRCAQGLFGMACASPLPGRPGA